MHKLEKHFTSKVTFRNVVTLSCVDNDYHTEDTATIVEYCFCLKWIDKYESLESDSYKCI